MILMAKKGKARKKCTATVKKVGNHIRVKTTCSLAKMKISTKRRKGKGGRKKGSTSSEAPYTGAIPEATWEM